MVKNGLPAFAYTSEAFEQLEKDTLFANHWVFVGFTHQLQKVGDVQPIMVAGKPVLWFVALVIQSKRFTTYAGIAA